MFRLLLLWVFQLVVKPVGDHHNVPGRILQEDRAESTAENFAFSKAIIDQQLSPDASIGFVTTRFHVFRASRVARKGGIDARGLGAPDVWYLAINNFLRECVGICWYTVKGWI